MHFENALFFTLAWFAFLFDPSLAEAKTEGEELPKVDKELPSKPEKSSGTEGDHYDPDLVQMASILPTAGALVLGGSLAMAAGTSETEHQAAIVVTGVVIGSLGLTVGPSIGHFYTGNLKQGFITTGIRLALGGLGAFSFSMMFFSLICSDDSNCTDNLGWAAPTFFLSSIGYFATIVYDFATAKRSARRANERIRQKSVDVSVAPTVFGLDGVSGGLVVSGTF